MRSALGRSSASDASHATECVLPPDHTSPPRGDVSEIVGAADVVNDQLMGQPARGFPGVQLRSTAAHESVNVYDVEGARTTRVLESFALQVQPGKIDAGGKMDSAPRTEASSIASEKLRLTQGRHSMFVPSGDRASRTGESPAVRNGFESIQAGPAPGSTHTRTVTSARSWAGTVHVYCFCPP